MRSKLREKHSFYAEPVFVDPMRRDYRLKPGTPGSGAASNDTDDWSMKRST